MLKYEYSFKITITALPHAQAPAKNAFVMSSDRINTLTLEQSPSSRSLLISPFTPLILYLGKVV